MMESLRNAAKNWVAKILLGLLAISFGVWGIQDVFRGYSSGALATVGGIEISGGEFDRAFNRQLQLFAKQTGQNLTPDEARKLGIDRQVLEGLIQQGAVDSQIKELKLNYSDAAIIKETQDNPAFKTPSGQFDPAEFDRLLSQAGMSEEMYIQSQRQDKLRGAITGTVVGDFSASKALIEAFYKFKNEQRDARYFIVKTETSELPAPTEAEIKKQYESAPAAYTAPEYRTIAILKADPADVAAKINLTDKDIQAGYDKYKADYYTPEKRTVLQITFPNIDDAQKAKDKIAAGTDFMAIATERGLKEADITFADKTPGDFLDPAIAKAAFALPEGAVSDPVKGGLAIALLKVTKVSPEHQKTLDEVKAELTQRLQLERAKDEIDSVYNTVEDARAAQTKFEDIATQAQIPFLTIGPVDQTGRNKDGNDADIPHKVEVLKAAFASDVGVENEPLSLGDGYTWYEVREVTPSKVKPLDQVKAQVISDITAAKIRELSLDKAKKLVERAKGGQTLDSLAQEGGATTQTAQGLKRNETAPNFDAGAISALFAVPDNGFAFALEGDGKGARVMQSQPVLLPPFDPTSQEAKTIGQTLQQAATNDLITAYLGAAQNEAGVSINEYLWRQISGNQAQ